MQAFSAGGFSDFSVLQRRLFQTRESCEGTRSERTKESAVSRAPICLATLLLHNDDVALRVAGVTEGCFQVGSER